MGDINQERSAMRRSTYLLIKAEFARKGRTFRSVASRLRVSPTLVTLVAQGVKRSARVERCMARALGRIRKDLWS